MMDTEGLYEFLILSKTLNFSKAADILYLSQSVLSRHIKALEQTFEVPLFMRSTHGVQLTEAGELLARQATVLMDECDHARFVSALSAQNKRQVVRVGCVLELAYLSYIQNLITHFRQQYPDIKLTITVLTAGTPESLIDANLYDIILTPCEFISTASQVKMHFIQSYPVSVALYPGHRLLTENLLFAKDLIGEQLLVPFAHELFGPYARNWKVIEKATNQRVVGLKMDNLATALFEAAVGHGVVLVPDFIKPIAPESLKFVALANKYCRYGVYIYYDGRQKNQGAQLFFEACRRTSNN